MAELKMVQNQDYEMVPIQDVDDADAWHVRITSGRFLETVVKFDTVKIVDESLHYSFSVVESPYTELKPSNKDLQRHVGAILYDLLDNLTKE